MSIATINSHASTPTRSASAARGSSAAPEDIRAMADALAAARAGKATPAPLPAMPGRQPRQLKPQAERPPVPTAPPPTAGNLADEADPILADREAAREQPHFEGFAPVGQSGQQPPVPAPAVPAPHADAAAFAQFMTRLWARESGKGATEVRVRFGDATWPATGARLVRNAAGALDIQLFVDSRQDYAPALETLRARFADHGVAVGALAIADGDA